MRKYVILIMRALEKGVILLRTAGNSFSGVPVLRACRPLLALEVV